MHLGKKRKSLSIVNAVVLLVAWIATGQSGDGNSKKSNVSVLWASTKVTFVEEHTQGSGLWDSPFGDIVVLDPGTGDKYYVTQDSFVDEFPAISSDGKKIFFASARDDNPVTLGLLGLSVPRELYVFDIDSRQVRPFAHRLQRRHFDQMSRFVSLVCMSDGSGLLYTEGENEVFGINSLGDSLRRVVQFPEDDMIDVLSPSPDGKWLAIRYQRNQGSESGVSLVDLRRGLIRTVVVSNRKLLRLGGWSPDSRFLILPQGIFKDTAFVLFDCVSWKSSPVTLPLTQKGLSINETHFLDSDRLVFLLENDGEVSTLTDLMVFELSSRKLVALTTDGYLKTNLAFSSVR